MPDYKDQTDNDLLLELAVEKASSFQDFRLVLDEFYDVYGAKTIARDHNYVCKKLKQFERMTVEQKAAKQISQVFEYIIFEQIEQSLWLGEDIDTYLPSNYDDIRNGADVIVVMNDVMLANNWALNLDVTFGSWHIGNKLRTIKNRIETQTLSEIKYFESEKKVIKGQLRKIPSVIIGADAKTVFNLMKLWVNKRNAELALHYFQFQMLEEIIAQLDVFTQYARSIQAEHIEPIFRGHQKFFIELRDKLKHTPKFADNYCRWQESVDTYYKEFMNQIRYFDNIKTK